MRGEAEKLIAGEDFRRRAEALGLELVRLPAECLKGLSLGAAERLWLTDWGLPRYAPPHLVFGDFEGRWLPRLADWDWLETKPPESLAGRRVLGADGEDRPICLPETEPAVLALDPARGFEPIWFNASIQSLACSCLACQEVLQACDPLDCVPPERVGALERRLAELDPSALRPGAFWAGQIQHLLDPMNGPAVLHYSEKQREFSETFELDREQVYCLHRIPIDQLGLGNRSEEMRQAGIGNLFVLLGRVQKMAGEQGRLTPCWLERGEEYTPGGCLVVHEQAEGEQPFPWTFPEVSWEPGLPILLADFGDRGITVGRGGGRWIVLPS